MKNDKLATSASGEPGTGSGLSPKDESAKAHLTTLKAPDPFLEWVGGGGVANPK